MTTVIIDLSFFLKPSAASNPFIYHQDTVANAAQGAPLAHWLVGMTTSSSLPLATETRTRRALQPRAGLVSQLIKVFLMLFVLLTHLVSLAC